MSELLPTGFIRSRLDERVLELQNLFYDVFGDNINLNPDSIDGQIIGIFAESINNLDQLIESVYASFNPQTAQGVGLARLVELNGIRKIKGRQSTVTVQCVGTAGTVIPQNALIRSDTNDQFKINEFGVIGVDGFIDMPASSVELGPIIALANSIRKIDTPVYGWQGVVNFFDAIPGRLEETDEQLRIRRRGATTTPAQSLLDSLYGALSNLPDVIQAKCYENFTGVQDANGLPPHSEYAIVNGGDEQEILELIWLKKGAGTTLHGTISGEVIDSAGVSHTIRFSRPTPVLVYLDIAISKRIGWPTDGETRIKEALVEWAFANQEIGEELIISRLYEPINKIPGHSVTSLFAGLSPNPTSAANIIIVFDALINFDTSRISITII